MGARTFIFLLLSLTLLYLFSLGVGPSTPLQHSTKLLATLPLIGDYFTPASSLWLHFLMVMGFLFVVFVLPPLYRVLYAPTIIIRNLEEVERDLGALDWQTRKQNAVTIGKNDVPPVTIRPIKRRGKQAPPPFPNSWFKVIASDELKKGECVDVEVCGQSVVVFRGENGVASVLDSYCPHLGANLGVMGQVVGDALRCPFHGWTFNGEGKCIDIPYAKTIPACAKTRCWPVLERNGMIMIYHHAEGTPPVWEPPEVKGCTTGEFVWHGKSEHTVRAHIQEMPENGPDTAHLNVLHVPLTLQKLGLQNFFSHSWEASWKAGDETEPHLAHITVKQNLKFLNHIVPGTFIDVTITQVGCGLVHLHFVTPFGKIIVFETVTPKQALLQCATHTLYAERKVPRWFAKFVLNNVVIQFERDIPIWNNKVYLPNPMIVKEDGPILKYRRWFTQFYSENSANVGKDPLDW